MQRIGISALTMVFILALTGAVFAGSHLMPQGHPIAPEGTDAHYAYEWDTFTPGKPNVQVPGAALAGPGDMHRYTVIIDDKYANDPNYEIIRAVLGVHIDDYDASREGGDGKPEWGSIIINGKVMSCMVANSEGKRTPQTMKFMEIVSDAEVSPNPKRLSPPYVYTITDLVKQSKTLVVETTNLREDGTIDSNAPFGDFVVNRIGVHVFYKKK